MSNQQHYLKANGEHVPLQRLKSKISFRWQNPCHPMLRPAKTARGICKQISDQGRD